MTVHEDVNRIDPLPLTSDQIDALWSLRQEGAVEVNVVGHNALDGIYVTFTQLPDDRLQKVKIDTIGDVEPQEV